MTAYLFSGTVGFILCLFLITVLDLVLDNKFHFDEDEYLYQESLRKHGKRAEEANQHERPYSWVNSKTGDRTPASPTTDARKRR